MEKTWIAKGQEAGTTTVSKSILTIVRIGVWGIAVVFVLDNLGFNISAVVAGLGIGGVAVALAAQTILGDLFNYFVIFFDKPFRVGDFLILGDFLGSVEHVGIKTTRLRSLGGEQIIMSNSDLIGSAVGVGHNPYRTFQPSGGSFRMRHRYHAQLAGPHKEKTGNRARLRVE